MSILIRLSDGREITPAQFRRENRNIVFTGSSPSKDYLSSIGASVIPAPVSEADVRKQRDGLLAETDWMALSDVTMSAEMATYRQALRDITDQQGFPSSVTWPTKPE